MSLAIYKTYCGSYVHMYNNTHMHSNHAKSVFWLILIFVSFMQTLNLILHVHGYC